MLMWSSFSYACGICIAGTQLQDKRLEPTNHPWKERKMIFLSPPWLCSRSSSGVYMSHISINSLSKVVCNTDFFLIMSPCQKAWLNNRFQENVTKSHYMNELVFPRISLVNIEAYKCLWVPRCWLCEDSTKIVGCDARLCCILHHLAIKLSPATWCCVFFWGGLRKMEADFLCQFVIEWPYGTVLPYFFLFRPRMIPEVYDGNWKTKPLEKQGEGFLKSLFRSSMLDFQVCMYYV